MSVLKGQGVGRSPEHFDSASEAAVSWCPCRTKSKISILSAAKTLMNDGALSYYYRGWQFEGLRDVEIADAMSNL